MFDDTDELLKTVGLTSAKLQENSAEVASIRNQQQSDMAAQLLDKTASTEAKQELAKLNNKEVQAAENRTAAFASTVGANSDLASDVMLRSAEEIRDRHVKALDARDKLEKAVNTSFWDNPLDYIWENINMESTIRKAEAATISRNDAVQGLQQIQQATQNAVATNNSLIKTKTDAMIQAEAARDKADADMQYKDITIRNAGINMDGLARLSSMTTQELSVAGEARTIRRQEDSDRRQAQSHAMAMKESNIRLEALKAAKDEKELDKLDLAAQQDYYIAGAKSIGVEVKRMPDRQFARYLLADNTAQEYYKRGMQLSATTEAPISSSAGNTAMFLKEANAPLRPEQAAVKQLLSESITAAASSPMGVKDTKGNLVPVDPSKKDSVANATTIVANKKAMDMQKNITADPNNIYAPPPLPSVYDLPAVKNSAYAKKVLAPQMQAGGLVEFQPAQLISMATNAIRSKQVTYDEAVQGLSTLFNGAREINNATKSYKTFGLPSQTTFNITTSGGWGDNKSVNLADQTQLKLHVSSQLSNLNKAELLRKDVEAGRFPGKFEN